MTVETLQLHYRTANEVIPVIQPFVDKGGVVSGQNFTLIIKSTPDNIAQIKQMLTTLDKAPQQMRVSVRQGEVKQGYHEKGVVNTKVYSTGLRADDHGTQQVMVADGQTAFISIGLSVPTVQVYQNNIAQTSLTYDYKNVASGYYVTPRLLPDEKVRLNIARKNDSLAPSGNHAIKTQSLETQVTIPTGQWVNISSVGRQQQSNGRDIIVTTGSRRSQQNDVFIKVDVQSNITP